MIDKIKFGTDGWRAVIGDTYTIRNIARVAEGTAQWVKQQSDSPSIVIGHDCRFNGRMFMETAIKVYLNHGIKVYYADGFVSTPMVSMGTKEYGANIGVVLTASHNPPSYGGYKLKSNHGGPLLPAKIQEVEDLIPDELAVEKYTADLDAAKKSGQLIKVDLEGAYINAIKENFDIEAIKNSGLNLAFDAMYGSGQNVLKPLFPDMSFLHCEHNPGFMGQAPEPIAKNLKELEAFIKSNGNIDAALATDGDADRIGLYGKDGEFIDSHHIILLLIHYMVKYKGMSGKVVTAFSCSPKIAKMCEHYGLEHQTVKIGFKHIAGIMIDEDVLLGGEESGGIATKGHIPERDGIWMGMIIWEFMAKSGKSLASLIDEVYEIVGGFKFERSDLHISEDLKLEIIENCKNNVYASFGEYKVDKVETIDGFKFYLPNDSWVMIRPSGTEPVLRVYAEATDLDEVRKILKTTETTLLKQ
ncbi:phosphohexomutase domain-containing protein [Brumimicrobium aurantiacum]|uniref:phosphoglucomutase/phosphomannomutase family protein n=1 Tax=Brumimicrobium aurantiacum TaxID=1737063 RepID=UPI001F0BE468|nr:phosphoglucomutase/phosphomannomutase family protein [Brumimicrobium aurantiacum]